MKNLYFLKGFCLYLWTENFWDDLDPHGALYSTLDLVIFNVFEGQFLMIVARKIVFLAILRANMNARGKFFLPVDRASKTTPKVHRVPKCAGCTRMYGGNPLKVPF